MACLNAAASARRGAVLETSLVDLPHSHNMIHALTDDHTELDVCLGWTVDLLDNELYALDTNVNAKTINTAVDDDNDIDEDEFLSSSEGEELKELNSSSNVSCSESEDDSVSQSPRSVDEIDQPAFPSSSAAAMGKQAAPVTRVRRKRKRMSVEERRIRHREAQRQFMKRKRARINALRQVIRGLERQAQVVQVMRECEALRAENEQLREACAIRATLIAAEAMRPPLETSESTMSHVDEDAHVHAIWDDLLMVFDDDEHARRDAL